jgi:DNA-binding CsgD family transcriptional regulator
LAEVVRVRNGGGTRTFPAMTRTASPSSVETEGMDLLDRAGVTPREREVLALLGVRLSNDEIAGRLFISVRTVESHVSALLMKLGVGSHRDLASLQRLSDVVAQVRPRRAIAGGGSTRPAPQPPLR